MIKSCLTFILIISNTFLYAQEFENYESLDFLNNKSSFKILENKLDDYTLIVIGEQHFLKANIEIQFQLFKYLYLNENVRHICIEYGQARALKLNLYFKTGDKKILFRLIQNKVDVILYLKLKEFYDSLPEGEKFMFHGIDYEKDGIGDVKYVIHRIIDLVSLNKVILSKNTENFIDGYNSIVNSLDNIGEQKNLVMNFLTELKNDTSRYRKEYGEYYEDLMAMNESLKFDFKKSKKNKTFDLDRENLIYNQTLELGKRFPNSKLFCIFGTAHIPLKKHNDWASIKNFEHFVSMLNTKDESPFKDKVFSILPLYKSCIPPWKKHYAKRNLGLIRPQLDELDKKSKGNLFTLFEYPNETEEQKKFRKEYYQMILINRF